MGHQYIIVNHTKKEVICPTAKIRELYFSNWYYVLMELLATGYNKGKWAGDSIELVGDENMIYWESCLTNYKDVTKDSYVQACLQGADCKGLQMLQQGTDNSTVNQFTIQIQEELRAKHCP